MKNRKVYYDILRILAILCVIYNHTNKRGYYLYAFESALPLKIFYILMAEFVAIGVPLFFMISGALLLGKEESIGDVYKKRLLRMLIVLIVFSLIQFIHQVYIGEMQATIGSFFNNIITKSMVPSYWFLYAYLAYLIILPLLRKLVKAMSDDDFKYLIIIYLVIEGLLTIVLYLKGYKKYSDFFERPLFDRIIIFPVVGYYLENRIPDEKYNVRGIYRLIMASAITFAVFVAMTLYRNLPYEEFTTYDKGLYTCGLTLILDITVFYIIKFLFDIKVNGTQMSSKPYKFITVVGTAVFGVYLIEGNVRYYTEAVCAFMSEYIGDFPAAIAWVLIIFSISLVISLIMKIIPGLKKVL